MDTLGWLSPVRAPTSPTGGEPSPARLEHTGAAKRQPVLGICWLYRMGSTLRIRSWGWRSMVLRIDCPPYLEQSLTLTLHRHHVTRDVETNRSGRRVTGEGQRAILVERLDVAITVALVSESNTSAEARDELQLITVLKRVAVQ